MTKSKKEEVINVALCRLEVEIKREPLSPKTIKALVETIIALTSINSLTIPKEKEPNQ